MVETQKARKREQTAEEMLADIRKRLNVALDQVLTTRGGFTPETMRQFEREGMRREQERAREQMRATPVRREEPELARGEERAPLRPEARKEAIEQAVRMGEMMELAVAGRRPRGEWATS